LRSNLKAVYALGVRSARCRLEPSVLACSHFKINRESGFNHPHFASPGLATQALIRAGKT